MVVGIWVCCVNYVYGLVKVGLDGFVSGLVDVLYGIGVWLLIVWLGFVIGCMIEGMMFVFLLVILEWVVVVIVCVLVNGKCVVWILWVLWLMFVVLWLFFWFVWCRML